MIPPILITIPICPSNLALSNSLVKHLAYLGPALNHGVLFVASNGLTKEQIDPLLEAAKPIFPAGGTLVFTPAVLPQGIPDYPQAHNLRFETAARHIEANHKAPFLWLDPHCVPTRKGWLIELETEYRAHAHLKPVMGQLMTPELNGTAEKLISGTAIYPASLPKRIFQRLVARRDTDWEKSCADLLVPIAHPTQLIWIHALDGTNALPKPPSVASVIHTARAKDYAATLRGERVETPAVVPVQQEFKNPIVSVSSPGKIITGSRSGYYHSGDLGDIIYALAAIRLAGGGQLYLGPRSRKTPPPANPIREPVFNLIAPLLNHQPYISKATYTDRYPGTDAAFDLNIFRSQWGDKGLRARTGISTLVRMHCHTLGVDEKFKPSDVWLTVPNPISTGLYTVHRSVRYRAEGDKAFPWEQVVRHFSKRLLFVGLPQEHADFQREFNCRVAFWLCQDFLELARVIAGSLGFIGNQSFPNALALGLGQKVLQESWPVSPDCVFSRPNFLTQPFGVAQMVAWERNTVPTPMGKPKDTERRDVIPSQNGNPTELGPLENASGLGDILTITPLASRLGNKAILKLPEEQERFAALFDGICPVQITKDYPVFRPVPNKHFITSKLSRFGFTDEDGTVLPIIKLKPDEIEKAKSVLQTDIEQGKPLVVLHTICAPQWAGVRSRSSEHFQPIADALKERFTVVKPPSGISLRELAAIYHVVGRYCGVNTGDWHLAMAVGCRALVMDAEEQEGYSPIQWRYKHPCVSYVGIENIEEATKLIRTWL